MMDELLQDLQINYEIDRPQAEIALGTVLGFIGKQLPSPIMGRIKSTPLNKERATGPNPLMKDIGNAVI